MHNVHFILLSADSAQEAAESLTDEIASWGNENNWRSIGGIASEDGSDDCECYDSHAAWTLKDLDKDGDLEADATRKSYFELVIEYAIRECGSPIYLPYLPDAKPTSDPVITLEHVQTLLKNYSVESSEPEMLRTLANLLLSTKQLIDAARFKAGLLKSVPSFNEWAFDTTGLTDMSDLFTGERRYLVMLDMHS